MTPERKQIAVASRVGVLRMMAELAARGRPLPARLEPPPEIAAVFEARPDDAMIGRRRGLGYDPPGARGKFRNDITKRRRKNQIARQSRKRNR